jgi:hydrogenase nickel incorporation protein HypA/HybF
MHEIGIADSIIEAGQAEAARCPGAKLVRIGIRIGTLSGVQNDALKFALMALTRGTELDGVDFDMQICPRRDRCLDCDREFESVIYSHPCPGCGSARVVLVGGDELELTYVEVEEV